MKLLIETKPGIRVVGEADNYSDAITIASRERPDVIMLDLMMGSENGLDYLPKLRSACDAARILIVTGLADNKVHLQAVQLGAVGLVLKEKAPEVLIKAIEKVHNGEVWLDRSTVANVLTKMSGQTKEDRNPEKVQIASLTKRERDIITLVAQGLRNKQVAEQLSISDVTVRHHLTAIFGKLGVADRFELIIFAYKNNLCEVPKERGQVGM
jgi:DNA-binding NarL/FixJ family response regulator